MVAIPQKQKTVLVWSERDKPRKTTWECHDSPKAAADRRAEIERAGGRILCYSICTPRFYSDYFSPWSKAW